MPIAIDYPIVFLLRSGELSLLPVPESVFILPLLLLLVYVPTPEVFVLFCGFLLFWLKFLNRNTELVPKMILSL